MVSEVGLLAFRKKPYCPKFSFSEHPCLTSRFLEKLNAQADREPDLLPVVKQMSVSLATVFQPTVTNKGETIIASTNESSNEHKLQGGDMHIIMVIFFLSPSCPCLSSCVARPVWFDTHALHFLHRAVGLIRHQEKQQVEFLWQTNLSCLGVCKIYTIALLTSKKWCREHANRHVVYEMPSSVNELEMLSEIMNQECLNEEEFAHLTENLPPEFKDLNIQDLMPLPHSKIYHAETEVETLSLHKADFREVCLHFARQR